MILALISAAAALATAQGEYPRVGSGVCPGGLCQPEALAPFFSVLRAAERPGSGRTVNIVQIGDSHTANENLDGAWRTILQTRTGDAGRGAMPPGRPWDHYTTRQVTVGQSGDWTYESTMTAEKAGVTTHRFGASGYRVTSGPSGGQMTLSADEGHSFRRLVVCAETGPGAGTMTLSLGAQKTTTALNTAETGVACPEIEARTAQSAGLVSVEGGPATLFSWASYSGQPGVVLSNLGLVGSQLRHMGVNGDPVLAAEFKAYAPDLIVIAYGTNEGFSPHFSCDAYEDLLRRQIERVRRLAPDVPILLLGAPDAQSKSASLLANGETAAPATPNAAGWFSPPALTDVRTVQRRVAASEHVALWEWADRMGGVGAAYGWATRDPALMRGDHVHFSVPGGQKLAEMLQADLDAAARSSTSRPPD